MPTILIVDENKPSVVMTSEIIKDHLYGVVIEVVSDGKACIETVQTKKFDMVIMDFDLPDSDGVTLAKLVRSFYDGPILLTAFDDEVVQEAIKNEMFYYSDICSYIKKPIVAKDFVMKLEKFLLKKETYKKQFSTDIPLEIAPLKSGKSKVNSVKGKVVNMSIGGAGINFGSPLKGKIGEEVSLILDFHKGKNAKKSVSKDAKAPTKIKAQLVKLDKTKKKADFVFSELSEKAMKDLEAVLRASKEMD